MLLLRSSQHASCRQLVQWRCSSTSALRVHSPHTSSSSHSSSSSSSSRSSQSSHAAGTVTAAASTPSSSRSRGAAVTAAATPSSSSSSTSADGDDAGDEEDDARPGKPLRVERLLANLGYGKRKECTTLIKRKQLVYVATGQPAKVGEKALASQLLLDGEPLDPPPPLTLLLHKPVGYVVTSPEDEMVSGEKVYDLLPFRFGRRKPFLSAVGRLDKDTSGLLIMTDDGQLLHSIQSPAKGIWKRYAAKLSAPLTGKDADKARQRFASGQLQLQGDRTPLLPAALQPLDGDAGLRWEVSICEGRYHQIKRMFSAVGHTVVELHRHAIGGLSLQPLDLPLGEWRLATQADLDAVLAGPDSLAAAVSAQQGQQQQQQNALREAPPESGQASSSSSTDTEDDGAAGDAELWLGEDVDHPGEVAAASKRFRSSSKRARLLSKTARALRQPQQQQPRQQDSKSAAG